MSRPSSISKHPHRRSIELDIALDVKSRAIAAKYGLSEAAICRYRQKLLAERPEYIAQLRDHAASARSVALAQCAIHEIVSRAHLSVETAARKIKEIQTHAT